jgi:hypothetical protein
MKQNLVIVAALALTSLLMLMQPIYAFRAQLDDAPRSNQSTIDVNTGFIIGAHDAADKCQPECHQWIDLPGNGFANKTQEFIRGYIYGWCSNPENINGAGREDNYNANWDCDRGPNSAYWDVRQLPPRTGPTELPAMPQVNNTIVGKGNATNSTG